MASTAAKKRPKPIPAGTGKRAAVQSALQTLGVEATPRSIQQWLSIRGIKLDTSQISNAKFVTLRKGGPVKKRRSKRSKVNIRAAVREALDALGTSAKPKPIQQWLSTQGINFTNRQVNDAKQAVLKVINVKRVPKEAGSKRAVRSALAELDSQSPTTSTPESPIQNFAAVCDFIKSYPDAEAAVEFLRSFPDVESAKLALTATETYLRKVKDVPRAKDAIQRVLAFQLP